MRSTPPGRHSQMASPRVTVSVAIIGEDHLTPAAKAGVRKLSGEAQISALRPGLLHLQRRLRTRARRFSRDLRLPRVGLPADRLSYRDADRRLHLRHWLSGIFRDAPLR